MTLLGTEGVQVSNTQVCYPKEFASQLKHASYELSPSKFKIGHCFDLNILQEEYNVFKMKTTKRGSPVHVDPACAGSREGSNHFGSYVHCRSLHFYKRLFPGFEPITSWSQGNSFTAAPGLTFNRLCNVRLTDIMHGNGTDNAPRYI
jgi:hypothetical protein